jgi:hypothetical protein
MSVLEWSYRLITNKISSRLGMLRKARKILPRKTYITLYNAMIFPLFDYSSSIWDSCGETNFDFLDKLQRRAASIIEGSRIRQCHINLTFSWPSLQSRRVYQICLQVFKCLSGLAPAYLLHEFIFANEIHANNTRNRDFTPITFSKNEKVSKLFSIQWSKNMEFATIKF